MKKSKTKSKIALQIFLALILVTGIFAFCFWQSQKVHVDKLTLHTFLITDINGDYLSGGKAIQYTKLTEMNDYTRAAFIAIEDKDFYRHNGLSYKRIIKAFFNNIRAGYSKEGASTITQQLIKNTHLTNEKSLRRKSREAVLALKLEKLKTKDEILELYLNAIYFGNNIYGIGDAAGYYFNKKAKDLTLKESAFLAALIQNPSKIQSERTALVLSLMKKQKYINDEEYKTAMGETIVLKEEKNTSAVYKQATIKEAKDILNLSEADIANYGYQIETYFDPKKQNLIYKYITAEDYGIDGDKCIILGKPNGQIEAMWASNPIVLGARRNFGSALKPIIVYAPALELKEITSDTVIYGIDDVNEMTVKDAIATSNNTAAKNILSAVGVDRSCEIAKAVGLKSLKNENASAALGNTTKGVSFFELTGAYQTLANCGKTAIPKFIKKITDRDGKIIYLNNEDGQNTAKNAISGETAYFLTKMLCKVSQDGTGRKLKYLPFEVASKTGTTERESAQTNTDATFASYTKNHVLIAWAGNLDMQIENDLPKGEVGGGKLGFIVRDIYKQIEKEGTTFAVPNSLKYKTENKIEDEARGQIDPLGVAEIWFPTEENEVYEIYKDDVLQEVITGNDEKYLYEDKENEGTSTYKVKTKNDYWFFNFK
ncbi:MAG: transglycosylase domain-containing protein [Christensenellaceae bacterium]|nr:transglycosylase domain-containing protein [Christensenellaceae bacterium]